MSILANAAIVVGTVAVMEAVAWAVHRYVMHGLGWGWHRSHHEPHDGPFELNDLYALVFAGLAIGVSVLLPDYGATRWVAIGMGLYGLLYFILHDGLVHQRWPFRHHPRHPYLRRLVQAHRLHHAVEGREDGVSYGFLYAPPVSQVRAELRAKQGDALRRTRPPA